MIPALAGNPAVTAAGPENVIRVVLGGLEASHGLGPMPAVGRSMSDGDVAAAVNYVRTAWDNKAPANAQAGDVAELRSKTRTLLAGDLPNRCPSIPNPQLSGIIDASRDQLKGIDLVNMLPRIDAIVPNLKTNGASDDDIVNALTAAYCPIVAANNATGPERAQLLGNFSVLVYGRLKNRGDAN